MQSILFFLAPPSGSLGQLKKTNLCIKITQKNYSKGKFNIVLFKATTKKGKEINNFDFMEQLNLADIK